MMLQIYLGVPLKDPDPQVETQYHRAANRLETDFHLNQL